MQIIIYGKSGCTFCDQAKNLCEAKSYEYSYKVVGSDITKEQLEEKVGWSIRTVPQIFIMEDGFAEYVGGYDQLVNRLSKG